jgi:hypothetical protein
MTETAFWNEVERLDDIKTPDCPDSFLLMSLDEDLANAAALTLTHEERWHIGMGCARCHRIMMLAGITIFGESTASCPSLTQFAEASELGWSEPYRGHVAAGCARCQERMTMQWHAAAPSLQSLIRHLVGGTFPDPWAIEANVVSALEAGRILAVRNILTPLIGGVQGVVRAIATAQPAIALASGAMFAPPSADAAVPTDINLLDEGLRWSAPVESGKQYVYIEATRPALGIITIAPASGSEAQGEPAALRSELIQLPLRGTPFAWRASVCLGDTRELIERYGSDYQVAVIVISESQP